MMRRVAFITSPLPLSNPSSFAPRSCRICRGQVTHARTTRRRSRIAPSMGPFDALKKAFAKQDVDNSPNFAQDFGQNRAIVDNINALEDSIERLDDDELVDRFARARNAAARDVDSALEEIFALVREATFRVLGLRHYDVQLLGGIELHNGRIAEMATGEGKTIVAALPAALNAAAGTHVVVVTVNDYLAKRDAELVGQVHRFLGLSVGLIQSGMSPAERRAAYSCDITYATNSELGFDYLRDNLAYNTDDVVLTRPFGFCIVDEADSVLIDEARTPLIISGKSPAPTQKYDIARKAADALQQGLHYTVSEKEQSVTLSERGYVDLENALKVSDLFDPQNPWASYIVNALKAKEVLKRDVNYIVSQTEDDESRPDVQIIDEFTGRVMKGRRWGNGLHQAVEAKEGIIVSEETSTAASISYQAFFKLFEKLTGMTGTAATEKEELRDIYGLSVASIPTALPSGRKDYPDVVYKNVDGKRKAIMAELARVAPTGRPILIGTTSVESSEALSNLLNEVEVAHEVLNAKPESALRESEIVAQAGRKFSITIATNMAGRGTDILLGGNASYFARALCRRELVKKNPELMAKLDALDVTILIADDALPADLSDETWAALSEGIDFVAAQNPSSVLESLSRVDEIISIAAEFGPIPETPLGIPQLSDAIRKIKEELEETVAQEREEVLQLGGLYIIGTERAESRRIDNQLRGRAGRQGDPGGTRFFLALDDTLFAAFGGDKLTSIMETFRVGDDIPLESKLVTDALDSAQENVEAYYRDMRQQLFSYDEVLAKQRAALYAVRREVLIASTEELLERFVDDCQDTAREILFSYVDRSDGRSNNFEGLEAKLVQFFDGIESTSAIELKEVANVRELVTSSVQSSVAKRKSLLNGQKENLMAEATRFIWLTQIDNLWMAHMKAMDYLKEFIVLRSYGSDDPLQQYQIEGFEMFEEMLANVRRNTVYSVFQYKAPIAEKATTANTT